ncbi:unnamed protein product [Camellia sinensis]
MHQRDNKEREREREMAEEDQARVDIWKYVFGYVDMAVVKCVIELGIPDALERHEAPMTLSELSSTLECSPPALYRIMRFLVHRQVFKEDRTSQGSIRYVQTPLSRLLMKNGEKSMAPLVLLESHPVMLAAWHTLRASVLANKNSSAFETAHGEDLWSLAATNPGYSKLINDAMACDARVSVQAVIDGCPNLLDGLDSLVDVGGGNGTTIRLFVKACPWIRGINFDLPHVVSEAPDFVGVENVGGDMFSSVPKADAVFLKKKIKTEFMVIDTPSPYNIILERPWLHTMGAVPSTLHQLLRFPTEHRIEEVRGDQLQAKNCPMDANFWILHDWGDDECIHILRKCREAIPKDKGKVIIFEAVIKEGEEEKERDKLEYARLMMDMGMMAHTNKGKERTSKEWAYILSEAGFTQYTIKPTKVIQYIIEAYP